MAYLYFYSISLAGGPCLESPKASCIQDKTILWLEQEKLWLENKIFAHNLSSAAICVKSSNWESIVCGQACKLDNQTASYWINEVEICDKMIKLGDKWDTMLDQRGQWNMGVCRKIIRVGQHTE